MGLIHNLLTSVIHLLFVAMDTVVMLILIKVAHDRWHFVWLAPFAAVAQPAVKAITEPLATWLSRRTGKLYPERTLLILLIVCLWLVRFIICGIW